MFPVVFLSEMTLDWVWSGPNTMRDLPTVSSGVGDSLQEVQEVIKHQKEPVKLSEIYISCRSESTEVFSSEMTLDWVWGGPNTMRDLPTVSPGVGGSLQEV